MKRIIKILITVCTFLVCTIKPMGVQQQQSFNCPLTTPITVTLSSMAVTSKGMIEFKSVPEKRQLVTQEEKSRFLALLNAIPAWRQRRKNQTSFDLGISDLSLRYLMENAEILSNIKKFEEKIHFINSPYHLTMLLQDVATLGLNNLAEIIARVLAQKITGDANLNLFMNKGDLDFDELYTYFNSLNKHSTELSSVNDYLRNALAAMYQYSFGNISSRIFSFKTNNSISSLAVDTKKGWLAASNDANELKLWQLSDGKLLATENIKIKNLISLVFNPESTRIMGAYGAKIYEYSVPELKATHEIGEDQDINRIAFSPKNPFLAIAGGKDGKMLSLKTGKKSYIEKLENKSLFSIGYNKSGSSLVAAGSSAIWLYKGAIKGEEIKLSPNAFAFDPVNSLAFGTNEDHLFAGTKDGIIARINLLTKKAAAVSRHEASIKTIIVDEKRSLLISGDTDGLVKVWRIAQRTLQLKKSFKFNGSINALALSSDNNYLFIGTAKDGIRVVDMRVVMDQLSPLNMIYFIYIARKMGVAQKGGMLEIGEKAVDFYNENIPAFIRNSLNAQFVPLRVSTSEQMQVTKTNKEEESPEIKPIEHKPISIYERMLKWFSLRKEQAEKREAIKKHAESQLEQLD
ncbi:hypothetical protein HYX58_05265 [Candidatus Dependentiae bacterium]|nr:hypothetical protein [Candidatus Dependentiae bacterium]